MMASFDCDDDRGLPVRKLVILGDGEVGKTSFLFRFCEDKFTEGYVPTIFENYHKEYEHDGVNKLLMICDTAGQEAYDHVRPLNYHDNVDVVFIAFSIVNRQSFNNVKKRWHEEQQKYMKSAKIVLIGTKADLKNVNRKSCTLPHLGRDHSSAPVSKSEGEALAREIKAHGYFATSSKTGDGVVQAFKASIDAAEEKNKIPFWKKVLLPKPKKKT